MADEKSRSSIGAVDAVVNEIGRMGVCESATDESATHFITDSVSSMDSNDSVEGANALIVTKVHDSVFENDQSKVS